MPKEERYSRGFRNPRGERSLFLWDGTASEFKRCISGETFSRCSGSRWRIAWWCQSESGPEFWLFTNFCGIVI